ncbi:hypothetical protein [Endozoicomonas sp. 4G]|uniref:hypothetical protein n=1 Tax=Endozoicomonas sp. 4G TaxID=2872754 RepID=UPI002079028E|nr:hypothetical protein [Endozoicomonas sp. 4G]
MGIISGGEKVSISPTWSEHGQQKVEKPKGHHKGSSISSVEDAVPQNGKGKKLPKKSLFSRSVSNSDKATAKEKKAAAKEKKATEKKAVKAFKLALNDVKKAVNNKNGSYESVLRTIKKHARNQGEVEDLLANLTKKSEKSGQPDLQPHVQKAFKEAGFSIMLLEARYNAHQPLKEAPNLGEPFRKGLDKCMQQLRAQREELKFSNFPDSIRNQLKSCPALSEYLVEGIPDSKAFSSVGRPYPSIQAQAILTCQCFEQAHQIKKNLGKAVASKQLPPKTKVKVDSALKELQEILEATPKDLKKLEKSYAFKGEGSFLKTEYREALQKRIHENTVQPETKTGPKKPDRAPPTIPFRGSLTALTKEKPEFTNEANLLNNYLNELLTFSNSSELVNLLGKEFAAHLDAGWDFDQYASLCQQAVGITVDNPSMTIAEVMAAAYENVGTSRE